MTRSTSMLVATLLLSVIISRTSSRMVTRSPMRSVKAGLGIVGGLKREMAAVDDADEVVLHGDPVVQRELLFLRLAEDLHHDRDLDRAGRVKAHVGVDQQLVAAREIVKRHRDVGRPASRISNWIALSRSSVAGADFLPSTSGERKTCTEVEGRASAAIMPRQSLRSTIHSGALSAGHSSAGRDTEIFRQRGVSTGGVLVTTPRRSRR